jgi:hypothetical protein
MKITQKGRKHAQINRCEGFWIAQGTSVNCGGAILREGQGIEQILVLYVWFTGDTIGPLPRIG